MSETSVCPRCEGGLFGEGTGAWAGSLQCVDCGYVESRPLRFAEWTDSKGKTRPALTITVKVP